MFNNFYQIRCLVVCFTVINFIVAEPSEGNSLIDQLVSALAQVFFFLLAMAGTYRRDQRTPIRKVAIVRITS